MRIAGFDWDEGNRDKCGKHGVSCKEIEALFARTPRVFPDMAHSHHEQRWRAIGTTENGIYVFVVFTLRPTDDKKPLLRPISARYMHKKEVLHYEQ